MNATSRAKALEVISDGWKEGKNTFILLHTNRTREKARLFIYNEKEICRYKKNSRTKGSYLDTTDITEILPLQSREVNAGKKFTKNCNKVLDILRQSGWWEELIPKIAFLRDNGLEECLRWEKDYWCHDVPFDQKEERERRRSSVPEQFDCETFWMIQRLKIEKMYFGINSEYHLQDIARSVKENRPISFRLDADKWNRLSYDTSFEFNPEKKKGWYSKEYRNCGNGHYYLALSPTHAIFYEDD